MADNIIHLPSFSYVSANINCNISFDRTNNNLDRAQQWLGDRVLEDCKPYMPLLTGAFQQLSTVLSGGREVLFPGPYGRFLYMGKVMVDPDTGSPWARAGAKKVVTDRDLTFSRPGATAMWFEAAKAANCDYWVKGVQRIANGG
jgi:hypothetical protein